MVQMSGETAVIFSEHVNRRVHSIFLSRSGIRPRRPLRDPAPSSLTVIIISRSAYGQPLPSASLSPRPGFVVVTVSPLALEPVGCRDHPTEAAGPPATRIRGGDSEPPSPRAGWMPRPPHRGGGSPGHALLTATLSPRPRPAPGQTARRLRHATMRRPDSGFAHIGRRGRPWYGLAMRDADA